MLPFRWADAAVPGRPPESAIGFHATLGAPEANRVRRFIAASSSPVRSIWYLVHTCDNVPAGALSGQAGTKQRNAARGNNRDKA
jgi:hypothetical protein